VGSVLRMMKNPQVDLPCSVRMTALEAKTISAWAETSSGSTRRIAGERMPAHLFPLPWGRELLASGRLV